MDYGHALSVHIPLGIESSCTTMLSQSIPNVTDTFVKSVRSFVHPWMPWRHTIRDIIENKCLTYRTFLDEDIISKMVKSDGMWTCSICSHSSLYKGNVYKHVEAKHTNSQYLCHLCHKVCPSQNALQAHTSRYHRNKMIEWCCFQF